MKKRIEIIIAVFMLLFSIGFNLYVYRLEPTAKTDPNDNTFQFGLVDRTNQIWDFADKNCTGITKPFCTLSYLTDHWVPNWAEGYNLPYYYSHIPQVAIVASYRLISVIAPHYSLFTFYHTVIYLLLSLFPLSVFLALGIMGVSPIAAGMGVIAATFLSTDGLYGLDPSSFLWRGYGLSSQLFAMIWLPLALASSWRIFSSNTKPTPRFYLPAILFLAATTAGHLGIGIIAFISVGILAIGPTIQTIITKQVSSDILTQLGLTLTRLLIIFTGVGLLLGYWIVPILTGGNYHNISIWDPIWKFDSYGYREVLKNLFNGDLFDFGRLPILTSLVGIGLFVALKNARRLDNFETSAEGAQAGARDRTAREIERPTKASLIYEHKFDYFPFALLFLFWLLLYFGRTTWGHIIDLIPGMTEFHLSRFIVGVHIAGLFLIPLGFEWLASRLPAPRSLGVVGLLVLLITPLAPQTLRYAAHNDTLIKRANENYMAVADDTNALLGTLHSLLATNPGRVYAGRGGNWGKQFRVAETPYYLYLSTYGIPVILWLPETWSPNSDAEQYFSENRPDDYELYNVRYVVTPTNLPKGERVEPQPFWKPLAAGKTWKLYEVASTGFVTSGIRPATVSVTKTTYLNLIHLWIQSDFPKANLYPELTFDKNYPKTTGIANFRMVDEVTYRIPDGSLHNLFAQSPYYMASEACQNNKARVVSEKSTSDMIFTATVDVSQACPDNVVVLRQTFHPSWTATIDGEPVKPFSVFPFFTAISLREPGTHEVIFTYKPSTMKVTLLLVSLLSLGCLFWLGCSNVLRKFKTGP